MIAGIVYAGHHVRWDGIWLVAAGVFAMYMIVLCLVHGRTWIRRCCGSNPCSCFRTRPGCGCQCEGCTCSR